jgi:antitoxin ParD1/3/4
MEKDTSISLGDYFDNFILQQVNSGKYSSASEVVRAALSMFEFEEKKRQDLISELKKGEDSGINQNFNRDSFIKDLHKNL